MAEAEGLNLADPEDRAIFRIRVERATSNIVNSLVGALARQAGYRGPLASSRFAAARALADTLILRFGESMESLPSCGCSPTRSEMAESLPRPRDRSTPIAITLRHHRRRDLVALVTASASEPGRFQVTWVDNDGPSGHTTRDTPEEAVRYAVEEGYRLDDATTNARDRDLVERVQRAREARAAEIDSWATESLPRPGRAIKPFANLTAALNAFDARDLCGDLDMISRDAEDAGIATRIEEATDALKTAETVETMSDFAANLREAAEAIRGISAAASVSTELASLLARIPVVVESLPHPRGRTGARFTVNSTAFKRGDYVIRLGDMLGMEGELGGYVMAINRNEGTAKIEQDNGEVKPWPLDSLLHDTKENRAKREAFDDQIAADASVRVDQAVLEWKAR